MRAIVRPSFRRAWVVSRAIRKYLGNLRKRNAVLLELCLDKDKSIADPKSFSFSLNAILECLEVLDCILNLLSRARAFYVNAVVITARTLIIQSHRKRYKSGSRKVAREYKKWWRLRESNPWPPACKTGALANWAKSPQTWILRRDYVQNDINCNGGANETRTRDLCRDRAAL